MDEKNPLSMKNLELERNNKDPQIVSSNPEFNMCPAFTGGKESGICRVSGRPCIYSNADYKNCGLYELAKSGDPNLTFQIPFGRENSLEYQKGIKS
jgi:hypothetical protein